MMRFEGLRGICKIDSLHAISERRRPSDFCGLPLAIIDELQRNDRSFEIKRSEQAHLVTHAFTFQRVPGDHHQHAIRSLQSFGECGFPVRTGLDIFTGPEARDTVHSQLVIDFPHDLIVPTGMTQETGMIARCSSRPGFDCGNHSRWSPCRGEE